MIDPGLFVVGGLQFRGDAASSEGFTIRDKGVKGWLDTPSVRSESVQRPLAHGSFGAPAFYSDRSISIEGKCFADSPERMGHYQARLSGIGSGGGMVRMQGDYLGFRLWMDVRVEGAKFEEIVPGRIAEYMLMLRAPDPRKYGETRSFPDGSQAHHYGNFDATPEITVTGGMPSGYAIHGPGGKRYVVTQALAAGSTHRIDMRTGWLYRDGVLQVGAVGRADLWTVPPGGRVSHAVVPVSGVGQLVAKVIDTFV